MSNNASYELIELLYQGGATQVYRGKRPGDPGSVVLKISEDSAALRAELAIFERLGESAHWVKCLGLADTAQGPALVLDDDGLSSVAGLATGRPLPLADALRIGLTTAEAMAALHAKGVVHRDVKPVNLLVDPASHQVKLLDFGIAGALPPGESSLPADVLLGTFQYMAPEQTGRTAARVDGRADLYSLGITLYQLISGKLPFEAQDALGWVAQHLSAPVPSLRDVAGWVPEVVAAIVAKLMSKAPERRYQSASGLAADLQRCIDACKDAADVSALPGFALGQDDPKPLCWPTRIVGRDRELSALTTGIERARAGTATVTNLCGAPDSGERELLSALAAGLPDNAVVLQGRCEAQGATPLSGLRSALSAFAKHALSYDDEALRRLRKDLLQALGDVGSVLLDLAPEFVELVGPQPPLPQLGAAEERSRFQLVLRRVFGLLGERAVCVLALLDADHLDAATENALEFLCDPRGEARLCVVLCSEQPAKLRTLEAQRLELGPIDRLAVEQLLSEALALTPEQTSSLAPIVHERSQGHLGSVQTFVASLVAKRILRYQGGRYQFDAAEVAAAPPPESAANLIAQGIADLQNAPRTVLLALALAGQPQSVDMLAQISELSAEVVTECLAELVQRGLSTRADQDFQVAHPRIAEVASQQAAVLGRIHRNLGAHLLASLDDRRLEECAFAVVHHVARGGVPEDRSLRLRAARTALFAAQKAQKATSYDAALALCDQVEQLLLSQSNGSSEHSELQYAVQLLRGKTLSMLGEVELADNCMAAILSADAEPQRVAEVSAARIENLCSATLHDRAVDIGLQALARLGVKLQPHPGSLSALPRVLINQSRLMRLGDRLLDLPACSDPRAKAILELCSALTPPSYLSRPNLFLAVVEEGISWILRFGYTPATAFLVGTHALVVCGALHRYKDAYALVQRAQRLMEQRPEPRYAAKAALGGFHFTAPYFGGHDKLADQLAAAVRTGHENGDALFAGFCCLGEVIQRSIAGTPLPRIVECAERLRGTCAELGEAQSGRVLETSVLILSAVVAGADAETIAELAERADALDIQSRVLRLDSRLPSLFALFALGQLDLLTSWVGPVKSGFDTHHLGCPYAREVEVVWGLLAAERKDRRGLRVALRRVRSAQRRSGGTFSRHEALLRAEALRLDGKLARAIEFYGQAVAHASREGTLHLLAIALERCAQTLQQANRAAEAALYLREAHAVYRRWGHRSKVKQLDLLHPQLRVLSEIATQGAQITGTVNASSTHTLAGATQLSGGRHNELDLTTVLKVGQQISRQLEASGVVRSVLEGIAENAGAERVVLIMELNGDWLVEAEHHEGRVISLRLPLAERPDLPSALIRTVTRLRAARVVADVGSEQELPNASMLKARGVRSLAIVPILHQGKVRGVVLLEHRNLAAAFTDGRVRLVEALAAQAAISLDNASLYADVERRVELRTQELAERNVAMRRVLDNVSEGLVMVTRDGRLAEERSAAFARFFDPSAASFVDLFGADREAQLMAKMGIEQLQDGFLPIELLLSQLPRDLKSQDRVLEFSYQLLEANSDQFSGMLVVAQDVTEQRKREQSEMTQRQLVTMFERMQRDAEGFVAFMEESERLLQSLNELGVDPIVEKRLVHTLKGNTSLFGLQQVSRLCHGIEDAMSREERRMNPSEREALGKAWDAVRSQVATLMPRDGAPQDALYCSREDYNFLLRSLQSERHRLTQIVKSWQQPPVEERLQRCARQAHDVAERLGKGPIEVRVEVPERPRFADSRWPAFWAAFVHALRNAVDHGLEIPEERTQQHKGPGLLVMRAIVKEHRLVLELQDDGRGIDWQRIRAKALAAGLPTATQDDLVLALFTDGISSREVATEVSGRGVGMSALRDACHALGGTITVESRTGEGTRLCFEFPEDTVSRSEGFVPHRPPAARASAAAPMAL